MCMSGTPTVNDISLAETREIGRKIKSLSKGDRVRVTNNRRNDYVMGTVTKKRDQLNGEDFYDAVITDPDGVRYEIHANWRDIMPDDDDQETPYTGLIEEPFNDTAPAVTDLQVV